MHHKAIITEGTAVNRPSHVQCSCGTAGDFATDAEAAQWIQLVHFPRQTGISTCELVVPSIRPAEPVSDVTPSSEAGLGGEPEVAENRVEEPEVKENLGDA